MSGPPVMGVLTFGDNLTNFFHGDTLVRMWPDLSPRLPQEVRAAWEEQHLVLRACGRSLFELLRQAK
ncbi:MAG TPA: hypothetical protein VK162_04965 [Streptosporangiaceae bacterium]|nr:hypothetical protein [Streptosporangiaceae bacterium]